MHWLSKQPAWDRSREFDTTTRPVGRNAITQTTTGDLEEDPEEGEEYDKVLVHGLKKRKMARVHAEHGLHVPNAVKTMDCSELKISVVARNNDILKTLVLESKREYEKDAEHRLHILMVDTTCGCWRWNGPRQQRPMSSIVLEPGVKEMVTADCKDFLRSEEWHTPRLIR